MNNYGSMAEVVEVFEEELRDAGATDTEISRLRAPGQILNPGYSWRLAQKSPEETAVKYLAKYRAERKASRRASCIEHGVPELHLRAVYDVDPKETDAVLKTREWLKTAKTFLVLSGGLGTGKTAAAAWWAASRATDSYFVTADELRVAFGFENFVSSEAERMKKKLRESTCLVIDDLGTEHQDSKGHFVAELNALINHRYAAADVYTIITTNLDAAAFKSMYSRIADRCRECGTFVTIGGSSMRKASR
jgi:DNA replication protein DnaC